MIVKKESIKFVDIGSRTIRYFFCGWYLFGFIPLYVIRTGA
jgi:hypothetical protein